MLRGVRLEKSYGKRKVVEGVSVEIAAGEVVGLLGPNGAGKTTTFDMIVGLVKPDAGEVFFLGKEISSLPIHQRARLGISYLPQENSVFRNLSVEDNLRLVWEVNDVPKQVQDSKLISLLKELDIYSLKDNIAISLSGGERRRLEIARALANDPKLVMLDEPFSGVDPLATEDLQGIIRQLARQREIGILITDHNPKATLSITDKAYIIQEGKVIISGNSLEVANNRLAKEFYLGENFKLSA